MLTPDGRTVSPLEETLPAGSRLSRVHWGRYGVGDYNPGPTPATANTRFAFFGNPPVPVLYAAETDDAALAEVFLHDVPIAGGRIDERLVRQRVLSSVVSTRDLHLAAFHGEGFRRIGTAAADITRTSPRRYRDTVPWAAAAHAAGFDGLVWMSHRHDSARSYVFFRRGGAHGDHGDFDAVPGSGRAFAFDRELDWLTRKLMPLNVRITTTR